jgi:hypothetical protein
MASEQVQQVLQSLMFKAQQAQQQQKMQQDVTQNQAENQLKQQQIQSVQDRLQEEQRQFNLTHKATAALNDLEMQQREQNLVEGINKGVPVPGDTEISRKPIQIATDPDTNQPVMGEMVTHQLPTGHQVELPSQETLNKQHYYQVELPQIKAQQAAKTAEIEATKQADLTRYGMQKSIDLEKAQLHEDAETKRNDATNRTRIALKQMGMDDDLADPSPYIDGVINGDMTANDVKQATKPSQARTILNSLASQNFRPITSKQQDFLTQLKNTSDIIPKMDQLIGALPDTSNNITSHIAGLSAAFDPSISNLDNEIQGRAMPLARSIGMDKGNIPLKLLDKTIQGYVPSKYIPKAENIKRRNDFAKDLNSMIDAHLATLSPQQRLLLKKKYGLDNLTTPYGQTPTMTQGQTGDPFKDFGIVTK